MKTYIKTIGKSFQLLVENGQAFFEIDGVTETTIIVDDEKKTGKYFDLEEVELADANQERLLCRFVAQFFPGFPGSKTFSFCLPDSLSLDYSLSEELVFFPGSFDPWHEGHRACLDLCPCKNLVVIPDANPFKTQHNNKPWQHYLTLKEKLTRPVYPGFIGGPKNPTSTWLPFVQAAKLSLLIGEDNFLCLDQWHEVDRLLKALHKLYVVPRKVRDTQSSKINEFIKEVNPDLLIERLDHHPFEDLSSTIIREKST
jgi:nicotinate-nucleotide adenylyltransferase